ncbi:diacylglycerol kinase catalytic region [Coriobacterium glomerans PW2]|uniref:Diacylglycerol kinase catalytic region n=1 Tax=Coriobacterium glomerans (strain ATCC 49209 / DSM 20642 / JCM 10262 / PW2) TaxID=700015 RepID=F2NBP0_CORGP|nr:diacylglycerol kinase family protein [Coriobacterium glomerans]AEB06849.1 diacylglycerol kinase catalytic region [Coriobacterium glomerans PW2]
MRCLILHNLASGPRTDEVFTFCHQLARGGDEFVLRFIGAHLEPAAAVTDVRSFDRVVVSGGDGTVSNVLDCLRDSGVPVLVFPSGTANLFFNNIGNAPDAAALARACRAGRTVQVDMGELSWRDERGTCLRHGFIIIAGSGYDATIMKKAAPSKSDIGEIAYVLSALSTPEPQVARFTIEHDGKVDTLDGIACMVGNTALIQNEINLFPDCRMDDGLIDVAVVEPATTVQLLPTLLAAAFDPAGKGLGRPQFTMFQTTEVRVTCTPSLGMQYDGELIPTNSGVFSARVLPRCIDIIVDEFSKLQG